MRINLAFEDRLDNAQIAAVANCEPGIGEINYPASAGEVLRLGYRGPIGLEGWASTYSELALERFRAASTG